MGQAKSPSEYAAAGTDFKNMFIDPLNAVNGDSADIAPGLALGGLTTLYLDFHQGGSLDAQPSAAGTEAQRQSYGNYVYGVFFAAAGIPLGQALSAASTYGYKQQFWNGAYQGSQFGPDYRGIPIENVQAITAGYTDQLNGTLCQ